MKSENNVLKGLSSAVEAIRSMRSPDESDAERWKRLYRAPGGPLIAWLLEEMVKREIDLHQLAEELGITVGYLSQLHSGIREPANISRDFAAACGAFLRVPSVVVLVVSGSLTLLDFVCATDLDRWVEELGCEVEGDDAQLACGARLGPKELWLLPQMVRALTVVASVHETRVRIV